MSGGESIGTQVNVHSWPRGAKAFYFGMFLGAGLVLGSVGGFGIMLTLHRLLHWLGLCWA